MELKVPTESAEGFLLCCEAHFRSENKAKGYQDFNSYCACYRFHSFGYLVPINLVPCLGNASFKDTLLLTGTCGTVSTPRTPTREGRLKTLQ